MTERKPGKFPNLFLDSAELESRPHKKLDAVIEGDNSRDSSERQKTRKRTESGTPRSKKKSEKERNKLEKTKTVVENTGYSRKGEISPKFQKSEKINSSKTEMEIGVKILTVDIMKRPDVVKRSQSASHLRQDLLGVMDDTLRNAITPRGDIRSNAKRGGCLPESHLQYTSDLHRMDDESESKNKKIKLDRTKHQNFDRKKMKKIKRSSTVEARSPNLGSSSPELPPHTPKSTKPKSHSLSLSGSPISPEATPPLKLHDSQSLNSPGAQRTPKSITLSGTNPQNWNLPIRMEKNLDKTFDSKSEASSSPRFPSPPKGKKKATGTRSTSRGGSTSPRNLPLKLPTPIRSASPPPVSPRTTNNIQKTAEPKNHRKSFDLFKTKKEPLEQRESKIETAMKTLRSDIIFLDFLLALSKLLGSVAIRRKFLEQGGFNLLAAHLETTPDPTCANAILDMFSEAISDKVVFTAVMGVQLTNAVVLAAKSSAVKLKAFEFLTQLPSRARAHNFLEYRFSPLVLNALDYYNYKTHEGQPYQHLVQGLKYETSNQTKNSILVLLNTLLETMSVEDRLNMRRQLLVLGIDDVFRELGEMSHTGWDFGPLISQYYTLQGADATQEAAWVRKCKEFKVDQKFGWNEEESYATLWDALRSMASTNMYIKNSFFDLLRNLLVLQSDKDHGLQKWQTVEKLVSQLSRDQEYLRLGLEKGGEVVRLNDLLAVDTQETKSKLVEEQAKTAELVQKVAEMNTLLETQQRMAMEKLEEMEMQKAAELLAFKRQLHEKTVQANQLLSKLRTNSLRQLQHRGSRSPQSSMEVTASTPAVASEQNVAATTTATTTDTATATTTTDTSATPTDTLTYTLEDNLVRSPKRSMTTAKRVRLSAPAPKTPTRVYRASAHRVVPSPPSGSKIQTITEEPPITPEEPVQETVQMEEPISQIKPALNSEEKIPKEDTANGISSSEITFDDDSTYPQPQRAWSLSPYNSHVCNTSTLSKTTEKPSGLLKSPSTGSTLEPLRASSSRVAAQNRRRFVSSPMHNPRIPPGLTVIPPEQVTLPSVPPVKDEEAEKSREKELLEREERVKRTEAEFRLRLSEVRRSEELVANLVKQQQRDRELLLYQAGVEKKKAEKFSQKVKQEQEALEAERQKDAATLGEFKRRQEEMEAMLRAFEDRKKKVEEDARLNLLLSSDLEKLKQTLEEEQKRQEDGAAKQQETKRKQEEELQRLENERARLEKRAQRLADQEEQIDDIRLAMEAEAERFERAREDYAMKREKKEARLIREEERLAKREEDLNKEREKFMREKEDYDLEEGKRLFRSRIKTDSKGTIKTKLVKKYSSLELKQKELDQESKKLLLDREFVNVQMRELQKEKEEHAKRSKVIEGQLKELKIQRLFIEQEKEQRKVQVEKRFEEARGMLNELVNEEAKRVVAKREELAKEAADLDRSWQLLQTKKDKFEEQSEALDEELLSLRNKRYLFEEDSKKFELENQVLIENIERYVEDAQALAQAREQYEKDAQFLEKQLQEIEECREKQSEELREIEEEEKRLSEKKTAQMEKRKILEEQAEKLEEDKRKIAEQKRALEPEQRRLLELRERQSEEIGILEKETKRLEEEKRKASEKSETLLREEQRAREREKKAAEALAELSEQQRKISQKITVLEEDRKNLRNLKKQVEEEAADLEIFRRRRQEEHEVEAEILKEEAEWLAQKRAEHIEEAQELDQESELLEKRKEELKRESENLEKEILRTEKRKKEHDLEEKRLLEKEKLLAEKRMEFSEEAVRLEEERRFLAASRLELEDGDDEEEDEGDDGETESEVEDPEEIEKFSEAQKLVKEGKLAEFMTLIEKNVAIVNYVDKDEHNTLLHWATLLNHYSLAQVLLHHGAEQYPNKQGRTPLDLAKKINEQDAAYEEIVQLLSSVETVM